MEKIDVKRRIDAMVATIQENRTEDDVFNKRYNSHTEEHAIIAAQWLNGDIEDGELVDPEYLEKAKLQN